MPSDTLDRKRRRAVRERLRRGVERWTKNPGHLLAWHPGYGRVVCAAPSPAASSSTPPSRDRAQKPRSASWRSGRRRTSPHLAGEPGSLRTCSIRNAVAKSRLERAPVRTCGHAVCALTGGELSPGPVPGQGPRRGGHEVAPHWLVQAVLRASDDAAVHWAPPFQGGAPPTGRQPICRHFAGGAASSIVLATL